MKDEHCWMQSLGGEASCRQSSSSSFCLLLLLHSNRHVSLRTVLSSHKIANLFIFASCPLPGALERMRSLLSARAGCGVLSVAMVSIATMGDKNTRGLGIVSSLSSSSSSLSSCPRPCTRSGSSYDAKTKRTPSWSSWSSWLSWLSRPASPPARHSLLAHYSGSFIATYRRRGASSSINAMNFPMAVGVEGS